MNQSDFQGARVDAHIEELAAEAALPQGSHLCHHPLPQLAQVFLGSQLPTECGHPHPCSAAALRGSQPALPAALCPHPQQDTGAQPGRGRVLGVLPLSIPHPILTQQDCPALRRWAHSSSKLPDVTCAASGNIKDRCDQRSLVPTHSGTFLNRISSFAHLYEGLHSVLSQRSLQVSTLGAAFILFWPIPSI